MRVDNGYEDGLEQTKTGGAQLSQDNTNANIIISETSHKEEIVELPPTPCQDDLNSSVMNSLLAPFPTRI